MTAELRLGPLPRTASIKLTITIPERLKIDLDRYAELHSARWGEAIDTCALIPHMLDAFMIRDRGFRKTRPPRTRVTESGGPSQ